MDRACGHADKGHRARREQRAEAWQRAYERMRTDHSLTPCATKPPTNAMGELINPRRRKKYPYQGTRPAVAEEAGGRPAVRQLDRPDDRSGACANRPAARPAHV